jgi:hypothetical protein
MTVESLEADATREAEGCQSTSRTSEWCPLRTLVSFAAQKSHTLIVPSSEQVT